MAFPLSLSPAGLLWCAALLGTLVFASCRTVNEEPPEAAIALDQAAFALIDKDADGKVAASEMAAHKHQEGLAEIDLDNDKRLSRSEFAAARPNAPDNDGTFERLDRNKDGFVEEEEAVAYVTAHPTFAAAFKGMDRDGDGKLVWEEYDAGDASALNVTLIQAYPEQTGGGAAP